MKTKNIGSLKAVVTVILRNRSVCHGNYHAYDVSKRALGLISSVEQEIGEKVDRNMVEAIALAHDCWDHKFDPNKENMEPVKIGLEVSGFTKKEIELIVSEVDAISYSKGGTPATIEGRIVQDADRLSALGVYGVFRCFAYTAEKDLGYKTAIQHMEEKLVKLHGKMNYKTSKKLAEPMTETIKEIIKLAKLEINERFILISKAENEND